MRVVGLLPVLLMAGVMSPAFAQSYSVYEYLRPNEQADVATTAEALAEKAELAGLDVLALRAVEAPDDCPFDATVLAVVDPSYASDLLGLNSQTAPYTLVDRLVVFSDENGVHSAFVNPPGTARTIMVDNEAATRRAVAHRVELLEVLGEATDRGYGPSRERGFIGKTMGVMAGGPFDEKIQNHGTVLGANWSSVADALSAALETPGDRWGLTQVFRYDMPDHGVAILGVSGGRMEAKSFSIVGAGSDRSRKDLQCAGLAHAASYPLEMVVRQDGEDVTIEFVDAMYRMKLYFEDAGKWAFMKNMTMPGSIADELKKAIWRATSGM